MLCKASCYGESVVLNSSSIFCWEELVIDRKSKENLPGAISWYLSFCTLLVFLILGILGFINLTGNWQFLLIFLSLFFLGIPHGAADHLVLWGLNRLQSTKIRIAAIALYLAVALVYFTVWQFFPVLSLIVFLSITIFHWGQGDRYISIKLHGCSYLLESNLLSVLHILKRGALPIILGGYSGIDVYTGFLSNIINIGGSEQYDVNWLINYRSWFLVIPITLVLISSLLTFGHSSEKNEPRFKETAEDVFLVLWFLFIPTLWALGAYFIFWHSLRHSLRLIWIDRVGRRRLNSLSILSLHKRWLKLTGLMTIAAFALMIALFTPQVLNGKLDFSWLSKVMIYISILTLPHTFVVYLMDRKQIGNSDNIF